MKKLVLGSLVATSLVGTAFAAFSLDDNNINVVINANGSVRYDDNISQQPAGPGKVKDTIYEIDPGVEIVNARGAPLQAKFDFTEAITRYTDNTNLDTNLAIFDLTTTYTDPKNTAKFSAGYHELNQDTPVSGVPGLLRRNETVADAGDIYLINDKSKFGIDANLDNTKYKAAGLANSDIYAVPLTYYYNVSGKLDATLGVRYRKTDLSGGQPSYTDTYYNIGLTGDFNPKLTGSITVGLNEHRGEFTALSNGNSTSVGLDSNFTWNYSEITQYTLGVSNDFGAAASGQEQQTLAINAGAQTQLISQVLVGSANVSYSIINYSGPRVDDYWTSTLALKYLLSKTWSVSASYKFQNDASNADGSSFSDNTVALIVSLTY